MISGVEQSSSLRSDQQQAVELQNKVAGNYTKKNINCHGCENNCTVTKMIFPNGNTFYSGNRCEKIYTNGGKAERRGVNLPAIKLDLLFDRKTAPELNPEAGHWDSQSFKSV